MRNRQPLIVVDFETGGKDPRVCEPIQIAAVKIDPITLKIDEENTFNSLMKPKDFDSLEEEALRINKKTKEQLEAAPNRDIVWSEFCNWVSQFDAKKKYWSAPIFTGYNVKFDYTIYDRLCREYGNIDAAGYPNLFSSFRQIDVMDTIYNWFESSNDLENYKLDTVRDYFGISKEGAHDALVDVMDTARIYIRFLRLQRNIYASRREEFKGAFSKQK